MKRTFRKVARDLAILFYLVFPQPSTAQPNIIFVLADDLGWSAPGCYGNRFNETPNLDRLASEGLRFTDAYAAAPVCSPYRAALLTGQAPARVGITDYLRPNSANALSTAHITLPEMLQRNGYTTGMVGKWHLSGYRYHEAEFEVRPADHGFDWNIGSEIKGVGNGANTWPYIFRDQPVPWLDLPENRFGKNEYLTDRLNAEAVDFISRSAKQNRPFFLYVSHYAPHTILNGRRDLVEKYIKKHAPGKSTRQNCYICEDAGLGKGDPGHHWAGDHNPHLAAMLESIDDGIGQISAKLEELGIEENTIVIFTSDNGGETNVTDNEPFRGGKSQLYEGGIRVPLIVRWPARVPRGKTTDTATINTDFYPTLLDAAQIQPDPKQKLDGISILPCWEDPETKSDRDFLAWHYPLDRPHFLGGVSGGAIRDGGWKLIEHFTTGESELFSLPDDPGETKNLADREPDKIAELKAKLRTWRKATGARVPSPPLITEMRNLYFGDHFSPGLVSERLWYTKDWVAETGILKRLGGGTENTRIFLRDATYKDAVIRFDFRPGKAQDIRLMTGTGSGYNAVIHLRPDHFFIQTAIDRSVPYFSCRHSECAFDFEPGQWYTMTVEFLGDEVVAHLDHDHLAYAKHPIIDRTRTYLALQVDAHSAEFDNWEVYLAAAKKGGDAEAGRSQITAAINRYPVKKSLEEQLQIQMSNAHERLYRTDPKYRALVTRVDELDRENRKQFPAAYKTHKEFHKAVSVERKKLLQTDTVYKETLHATYRANRAIDAFLVEQKPEIADWPRSRKEAEIERLRMQHQNDQRYLSLVEAAASARKKLEIDYPQLFISDEQINAMKKQAGLTAKNDPEYVAAKNARAAAHRAQQDYLFLNDTKLAELNKQIETQKQSVR